jgi:hypothetical protein
MSAIAGGSFILHSDYLVKCLEEGEFVKIDTYEFGNPMFLESLEISTRSDNSQYKASYKWRQWIKDHQDRFSDGAFTDTRFILLGTSTNAASIANVVKAGGGIQIDINFDEALKAAVIRREKIDICFVESQSTLSKQNTEILKKCNVKILNLNAVNVFLMQDDVPVPLKLK